jgi:iron complex outermembrane receptor protein
MKFKVGRSIRQSLTVASAIAGILLFAAIPGSAAEISIKDAPLGEALGQLASQTGTNIVFTSDLVQGLRAKPVSGNHTVDEALTILLDGSGLTYEKRPDTDLIVVVRKNVRSDAESASPLGGVRGVAQRQSGTPEITEIVVTAQRRAERLQDVPIAVSVQTGEQLEKNGTVNIRELNGLVPGVVMQGAGLNTAPAIRGVFSAQSDPGNDGNIAMYVDDVYQASQLANSMDLPDIERVEVLKGPQGTLFGRNAAGGAIRLSTVGPNMSMVRGQMIVGYGSYNQTTVKGYVTGPLITDKLAASLSGGYMRSDGWNYDIVQKRDSGGKFDASVRAKVLIAPVDDLKIELFGHYNRHYDNDIQAYTVLGGNTIARQLYPGVIIPTTAGEYTVDAGNRPDTKYLRYEAGGKISYASSWGELSALAAWTHTHGYFFSDQDLTAAPYNEVSATQKQSDFQNELLFNSKKFGAVQFTIGTFYYTNVGGYQPLGLTGPAYGGLSLYGWQYQRTNAYAGFGEANIDLTDRITIIGGLRYSSEKRTAYSGYILSPTYPATIPLLGQVKFTSTTPRASIRYRLTEEDDNVYFTYSKGFKSGAFNLSGAQQNPILPEDIKAYELGIKTSPERAVSANVSVFYYDYTNQQVEVNTGTTSNTINAAASRMYGLDGDITARLTREITLNANFAYLDAKYRNFPNAAILVPVGPPGCACGNLNTLAPNLAGYTQPRSPKFTVGINASYQRMFSFGDVGLNANVYFSTKYYWDSNDRIANPQYATLGLSAQYTPTDSAFTFTVWGKNLTSAKYYYAVQVSGASDGVSYWPPATGGFSVKYAF